MLFQRERECPLGFTFFLVVWRSVTFVLDSFSNHSLVPALLFVSKHFWTWNPESPNVRKWCKFVRCWINANNTTFLIFKFIKQFVSTSNNFRGKQTSQNVGRPAINLAKYKRFVKSSPCLNPTLYVWRMNDIRSKSRTDSVQISRINIQKMIRFVRIEQMGQNILKGNPFQKIE